MVRLLSVRLGLLSFCLLVVEPVVAVSAVVVELVESSI
jgi:hypothetical protein